MTEFEALWLAVSYHVWRLCVFGLFEDFPGVKLKLELWLPRLFPPVSLPFSSPLSVVSRRQTNIVWSLNLSLSLSSPSRHPEDWLLIWSASPEIQRPNNNLCCASFLSLQVLFVCFLSFFVRFQSDSSSSFLIHFTADRRRTEAEYSSTFFIHLFKSGLLSLTHFASPYLSAFLCSFLYYSSLMFCYFSLPFLPFIPLFPSFLLSFHHDPLLIHLSFLSFSVLFTFLPVFFAFFPLLVLPFISFCSSSLFLSSLIFFDSFLPCSLLSTLPILIFGHPSFHPSCCSFFPLLFCVRHPHVWFWSVEVF